MADRLDAEQIQAALPGRVLGHRIVVLEKVTSTNDVVAQLAPESREGVVVIAERQSAGRGQYGRRWHSTARKGLWLSVLLRPRISVGDSGRLTELLAQSIATTISVTTGLAPTIKAPNDVYIRGRKVAGVLVEMRVEATGAYCAVAGMGVNVNHGAEDFPAELRSTAGSLAMFLGSAVERNAFAIALLSRLDDEYRRFSENSAARAAS